MLRTVICLVALAGMPAADLVLREGGAMHRFVDTGLRAVPAGHPASTAPTAKPISGGAAVPAADAPDGLPVLIRAGGDPQSAFDRRILHPSVVVRSHGPAPAGALAASGGGVARPGRGPWWIIDYPTPTAALAALPALDAAGVEPQPLLGRQQQRRGDDPLQASQWHLAVMGAESAWAITTGTGVTIALIDDCLQWSHPDLAANCPPVASRLHHNFNGGQYGIDDPSPVVANGDRHGTACAGLAGAVRGNGRGGSGIAPGARLFGLRLVAGPSTDEDEAAALSWRVAATTDAVQASSNSWGPPTPYEGPGVLTSAAVADAVRLGRGGRGTIICFAAGNDGGSGDDANADGYANQRGVLAIGGVLVDGTPAPYSEPGANLTVSAPTGPVSPGPGQGLVTTDLIGADGYNPSATDGDYMTGFNGTSGACPLVAGTCALMLAVAPRLGWRDVQEILIRTAVRNQPTDSAWATNGAGLRFSHAVGAGAVDAGAAVAMARDWQPLPAATAAIAVTGARAIPDADAGGASSTLAITTDLRCEHVTVRVQAVHPRRSDLRIVLTSPAGTQSIVARSGGPDAGADLDWTYLTVRCWGESSLGAWTLRVIDERSGSAGSLIAATLTVHGTPRSLAPSDPGGLVQTTLTEHGVVLGQSTTAPFAIAVDGLPAGRHHLLLTAFTATGQSVTSTVLDVPGRCPRIVSRPVLSATEGLLYTYVVSALPPAAGSVGWSLPVAPAGMVIDASGTITWTPPSGGVPSGGDGMVPVVVRASLIIGAQIVGIDDQMLLVAVHSAIGG